MARLSTAEIANQGEDALENNLRLQAKKIQDLLVENESLGAAVKNLESKVTILEQENARLLGWYDMATKSLQTEDLNAAQEQVRVLWSYVHAMGSPGHRAVSFTSRQFGKLWIGRFCKRSAKWAYAVIKA